MLDEIIFLFGSNQFRGVLDEQYKLRKLQSITNLLRDIIITIIIIIIIIAEASDVLASFVLVFFMSVHLPSPLLCAIPLFLMEMISWVRYSAYFPSTCALSHYRLC